MSCTFLSALDTGTVQLQARRRYNVCASQSATALYSTLESALHTNRGIVLIQPDETLVAGNGFTSSFSFANKVTCLRCRTEAVFSLFCSRHKFLVSK